MSNLDNVPRKATRTREPSALELARGEQLRLHLQLHCPLDLYFHKPQFRGDVGPEMAGMTARQLDGAVNLLVDLGQVTLEPRSAYVRVRLVAPERQTS